ncbi:ATP-binding protein [Pseudactinotalea sp. Z1748]|uniref:ATP-binding protein n=1 Tax=Pseudactinotalea sp. Z1748 TaxID=3413027 RepID=UPI003C7C0F0B
MTWVEANRDAIVAELSLVRARLRGAASARRAGTAPSRQNGAPRSAPDASAHAALAEARSRLDRASRLDEIAQGFGLTEFERSLLLLAAGPEIVAGTAADLALSGVERVTFGLALSVLPGAHWGALTPRAPLRYWRLIHLIDPTSPTHSPIVADERVLHHLLGAGYLDPDLAALAWSLPNQTELPPTLATSAAALVSAWDRGALATIAGPQHANLLPVASAAAHRIGHDLFVLDAGDLPSSAEERARLRRLMERESVLSSSAWAIDATGTAEPAAALRTVRDIDAPTVVLLHEGESVRGEPGSDLVRVPRVPVAERREVLAVALAVPGEHRDRGRSVENAVDASSAAGAFDLAVPDLHAAALATHRGQPLWEACRERASSRFTGLAAVIEPRASWELLVLPEAQVEQLRALVAAVRHQEIVLDTWGFAGRSARGLGTAALFAGASGTGKTLAAEVIATSLRRDLVVVDLSQVVSKYIGETEKNLRRVFEAAEDSGAVLLFDEADTLFGKRTEIRDSHDRYANLEVGYLLQRIESFPGLAILTTNAKSVLDQAFLRRLRFVVNFPYPDPAARERMWRLAFPAGTPLTGIDPARLATIDLPGGGIAAAALTAAYLGASRGEVTPEDLSTATRWELAKLGRSVAGR